MTNGSLFVAHLEIAPGEEIEEFLIAPNLLEVLKAKYFFGRITVILLIIFFIPFVGFRNSIIKRYGMFPSEGVELAHIKEFSRRTVGFACVPDNFAFISHDSFLFFPEFFL